MLVAVLMAALASLAVPKLSAYARSSERREASKVIRGFLDLGSFTARDGGVVCVVSSNEQGNQVWASAPNSARVMEPVRTVYGKVYDLPDGMRLRFLRDGNNVPAITFLPNGAAYGDQVELYKDSVLYGSIRYDLTAAKWKLRWSNHAD